MSVQQKNSINCPYCDNLGTYFCHADDKLQKFVPGTFIYYKCNKCKALFQFPLPTINDIFSFYPNVGYRPYTKTTHSRHDWTILGALPATGHILDVGCGGGNALLDFKNHHQNWFFTGIDFSDTAIACAANSLPEGKFLQGDANVILKELSKDTYDVVLAHDIIEHVVEPKIFILNLSKILKPGGKIYLTLPNSTSITMKIFRSLAYHLEAPRHLTVPSIKSIEILASQNGLIVNKIEGEVGGAMFWKSLPFSYAKAGWAYKLKWIQLGMLFTSLFKKFLPDTFSMVKIILVKDVSQDKMHK